MFTHAADDLDSGDQIEVVGGKERGHELTRGAGRQGRLGKEIQETVEAEESEDQAEENTGDQCGDFHWGSFRVKVKSEALSGLPAQAG